MTAHPIFHAVMAGAVTVAFLIELIARGHL